MTMLKLLIRTLYNGCSMSRELQDILGIVALLKVTTIA